MKTQTNLANYRLNAWSDFNQYLQEPNRKDFFLFVNKAYDLLLNLEPGDGLIIEQDVDPKNRERFIKVGCMFILENPDYEFSSDYRILRRMKVGISESINALNHHKTKIHGTITNQSTGTGEEIDELVGEPGQNNGNVSGWHESGGNRRRT